MNKVAQDILIHYGVGPNDNPPGRGSGRYPQGSGENPYQRSTKDFLERVDALQKEGFTYYDKTTGKTLTGQVAIARYFGMSSVQTLRNELSICKAEQRREQSAQAKALRDEGKSLQEIATIMGFKNDSSVRNLLSERNVGTGKVTEQTAKFLKKRVDSVGTIIIGEGVAETLGVSAGVMDKAVQMLERDGYKVYNRRVVQATNPDKRTTVQVLCPPGTEYKDIYKEGAIHLAQEDYVSHDGGLTFDARYSYPKSMDSKRLAINYAEDGGKDKDGVIEIRRGVKDLDLGNSHYAQVRILVDGTHYLKGMAVYSDDMPPGVDVVFNTNKHKGTPALGSDKKNSVLKLVGDDPKNPFGSLIKDGINDPDDPVDDKKGGQSYYLDDDGKKQLSLINKRAEEGDWEDWSDKLPSQFLSKQPESLVRKQLGLAIANTEAEYEEIKSLTNPTVKRLLLEKFADECDSAAVHLQAAALPSQKYHVILPMTTAKDTEVYAPRYKQGQTVALVRYPHAGTFEIPILKVNNNLEEGKRVITPSAPDAIGINAAVAQRLSGADFDGDTVMVIPCNDDNSTIRISSKPPLKDLEGFDPKEEYGNSPEGTYKRMSKGQTQTEMGKVSNLISDMNLLGATDEELARAVKYSMVVIDAEKHGLDWQKCKKDIRYNELAKEYQKPHLVNGEERGGAATIISRAKSPVNVPKTRGAAIIDPKTGKKSYKLANETYVDDKGKTVLRTQKSTQMDQTDNAFTLVSEARAPTEIAYAEYANHMKGLANEARKEMLATGRLEYSPSARKIFASEVDHLQAQLLLATQNKPRERMAQLMTDSLMKAVKADNPSMTQGEYKKLATRKLTEARLEVGAQRQPIKISEREWEAIQSGAVSDNLLMKILNHTDTDLIRQYATPRSNKEVSRGTVNRITAMKASGYTLDQIAQAVGLSVSTIRKYLD